MRQFHARFPGLVGKCRSHLAGFVLHVFVVVDAEPEVEVLEAVERVGQTSVEVNARLLKVDDGSVLGLLAVMLLVFVIVVGVLLVVVPGLFVFVFMFVVPVGMAVAGDAVHRVEATDGNPDGATIAYERETDGTAADLETAAGHVSADFLLVPVLVPGLVLVLVLVPMVVIAVLILVVMLLLFLEGMQGRGLGEPGNVVVVRLAGEGVDVPRDVAPATVEPECSAPAVAVVGTAQVEGAADALRHFVGDASPLWTSTTPPMAPEPYSRVADPFRTSTRSARKGSTVTAWSPLLTETSSVSICSSMMRTRAPPRPRMTGRPAPAP